MKKKLIKVFLLLPFLSDAQVKHGKEHDYMLLAMPASGSTFVTKAILKSTEIKAIDEIFNKSCYFKIGYDEIFFKDIFDSLLLEEYRKVWESGFYHLTKEVFFGYKIPFYQQLFQIFVLYRHRKYTFPATTTGYIYDNLYASFFKTQFFDVVISDIQKMLKFKKLNRCEQHAVIHLICYWIIFSHCYQYGIKIIDYEKLMTLNTLYLEDYLSKNLPFNIYTLNIIDYIIKHRTWNDTVQKQKQARYLKNTYNDSICSEVLEYLKKENPEMPYWYLLE